MPGSRPDVHPEMARLPSEKDGMILGDIQTLLGEALEPGVGTWGIWDWVGQFAWLLGAKMVLMGRTGGRSHGVGEDTLDLAWALLSTWPWVRPVTSFEFSLPYL